MELSTLGIKVKYAVESTAGTRPTTGFTVIRGVKSIPEWSSEPTAIDVTDLAQTVSRKYVKGLADPGSGIGLTVNDCAEFREDWQAMMSAFETAKAAGKALWIEYYIPDMKFKLGSATTATANSMFFEAEPAPVLFGGAEVDSALENTAYLMPQSEPIWAAQTT